MGPLEGEGGTRRETFKARAWPVSGRPSPAVLRHPGHRHTPEGRAVVGVTLRRNARASRGGGCLAGVVALIGFGIPTPPLPPETSKLNVFLIIIE